MDKITRLILFLSIVVSYSCGNSTDINSEVSISNETPKELSEDQKEVKKVLHSLYASIHVENAQKPDFDKIKSHFSQDARLGFVGTEGLRLFTSDEYWQGMEDRMSEGAPDLLEEFEIEGYTQSFGNIAYHTSNYGVYVNTRDSLIEQGIINYQLIKTDGKWKVLSMIWESEKGEQKVPSDYFD